MGYDSDRGLREALRMLDVFESVGVEAFDNTHTNLQQEKRGFRPAQSVAQARTSMPHLVPNAAMTTRLIEKSRQTMRLGLCSEAAEWPGSTPTAA